MNVHEFYKDAKGYTVNDLGWGSMKAQIDTTLILYK